MKNEIILCVGISGAGKSTWVTNFIKENSNYLRINRDDIRKTLVGDLNGYYQRKDLNIIEENINEIEELIYHQSYCKNYNVIIDNTNLKQSYLNRWNHIKTSSTETKFKLFDISLEDAQRRVARREKMQTFEDLGYIDKQYLQYQEIKKYLETNYKDKII